jgi:L-alanine-DL-glutamate epimerase-like enolase superfamily enzyme
MKASDIRVESVELLFSDERLAAPLRLSRGTIEEITYARVTVSVRSRAGQEERGTGAILLSDVWAFPSAAYGHTQKDAAMRAICQELAERLPRVDDYSDPLEKGDFLEKMLGQVVLAVESQTGVTGIPPLAAHNCLAPFDAAIHDAWGRAQDRPVYDLYTADFLNADMGRYLGSAFQGYHPADFLAPRRSHLQIQHVVGVGDALYRAEEQFATDSALPTDLAGWIRRDGLTSFKIKTRGQDPVDDARRVGEVYATASRVLAGMGIEALNLSVDPNEACPDADFLLEMLDSLQMATPQAFEALDYIEQPTARDLSTYTFTLHKVSERVPVLIDESFDSLAVLDQVVEQGWSGIALKSCKGQTASLLAYCWARAKGYALTVQDLTNPGLALVHSANLCAHLALSVGYFECNSRQYMPHACPAEQALYPRYFRASHGGLAIGSATGIGLY